MVEAEWSAVVADGFVVVDGQGSTPHARRMVVEEINPRSDRMESNQEVTVATVTS